MTTKKAPEPTAAPAFATPEMIARLGEPIPSALVKTKPGRGGSGDLSFIDARVVFDRFDTALGAHLWQVEIPFSPPLHTPEIATRNGKVLYPEWTSTYPLARIGVLTEAGWVWKQDIGDFSDIEPVKGSVSDSIKRAAVQWGVARELYNPSQPRDRGASLPEPEAARPAVVGQEPGLISDKQRAAFFAALKDAGVTGDQRKAILFLVTQLRSVKQMKQEHFDKVMEVLKAPRSQFPEIWENVELVSGE